MGELICQETTSDGRTIGLYQGDLTKEKVDVIVNAANSYLAHGGGVAAAIVRAGGEEVQRESDRVVREQGPVPVGGAAITGAGRMPCRAVIHAVGPRWGEGDEDTKLERAICSSLDLASEKGFETIAFPAISSGIFGFPKDRCAAIFWRVATEWLASHSDSSIREVRFTLIDDPTVEAFRKAWEARKASR